MNEDDNAIGDVDELGVPVDPMELLQCDSCQ